MSSLSNIRDGIKTRLQTITALANRAYDTWPDQILTPCAIVKPISWEYRQAMGNVNKLLFEIVIVAASVQPGLERAQDALDAYLEDDSATSIKKALEGGKTLSGYATTLQVPGWRDYGSIEIGGIEYLGAVVDVEVWA